MSELLPRKRANINKYAVEKRIVNFENQEQEYNTVGLMGFSTMLTKIYKIGTTHIKLQQEMGSGLGTIFAAMSYDPDKMEKFCVEIFRPTTTKETLLYGEGIAVEKKSQGEYLEKLGILKKKKLAAFY